MMSELSRSPFVHLVVKGAITFDFPTELPSLGNGGADIIPVIDGNGGDMLSRNPPPVGGGNEDLH